MKKLLISYIAASLIAIRALGADLSENSFEHLKKFFLNLPIGKRFRQIEKELNLPMPDKTSMGSSSYQDRQFRYYNFKGMMLQIGLKQISENSSYEKSVFAYNGDFSIYHNGQEYSHHCSTDGRTSIYEGPIRQ